MSHFLLFTLALCLGAALSYLWCKLQSRQSEHDQQLRLQEALVQKAQAEQALIFAQQESEKLIAQLNEQHQTAMQRTTLQFKEQHQAEIALLKEHFEQEKTQLCGLHESQLTQRAEQYRELLALQKTQTEQQIHLLREQLGNASEQILKQGVVQLANNNHSQLSTILNPLRESLQQMQEIMGRTEREQHSTIARLDESIKQTLLQTQLVGERADRLAAALTSENKAQGDFGELRLRTLLENMGLEEGLQFEEQNTLTDETGQAVEHEERGRKMRPDVVLHFPDDRDVIIDAKMSIKAFEDYHAAQNDDEKNDALRRHLLSIRNHVKELSSKQYSQHLRTGRKSLDFVVMYMFSESALQLALAKEPTLWKEAYDKGVFITGSQNLYALLRVLEMSWTQHRQAQNQQSIIEQANKIVSRCQLFYQRGQVLGKRIEEVQKAFADMQRSLAPNGQSILNAATQLVRLGAKEDKSKKYALPQANDETALPLGESDNDTPATE